MTRLVLLSLLSCLALSAQTDGITTSVSRTVIVPPTEVRFAISVVTPVSTTLEQVLERLAPVGVQPSDLVSQSLATSFNVIGPGPGGPQAQLQSNYGFQVIRPAADLRSVSQRLDSLRASSNNMTITFTSILAASDVAVEEMRRAQVQHLIVEARRKAESIASASGLALGPLLGVTDVSGVTGAIIVAGRSIFGESDFRVTYGITAKFAVK